MRVNHFLGLTEILIIHRSGELLVDESNRKPAKRSNKPAILDLSPVEMADGLLVKSDLSDEPAVIVLMAQATIRLTPSELDRFLRHDLCPFEYFALRRMIGEGQANLGESFYDPATGKSKHPAGSTDMIRTA